MSQGGGENGSVEGRGSKARAELGTDRREAPDPRLESVPTARRPGRAPLAPGQRSERQHGSATWCFRLLRGESLEALSR